jgi:hypothetical protein
MAAYCLRPIPKQCTCSRLVYSPTFKGTAGELSQALEGNRRKFWVSFTVLAKPLAQKIWIYGSFAKQVGTKDITFNLI